MFWNAPTLWKLELGFSILHKVIFLFQIISMSIEANQPLQSSNVWSLDLLLTFLSLKAVVVGLGVNDEGEAVRVAARAVLPHTDLRAQVGMGVKVDLEKKIILY